MALPGPDGILPKISRKNPEKDFELMKQIGSGTYGEVYKAKLIKTGQLCALKIIKIEPGEDFDIIQQEILILSECKHKNIVGYLGSYLSEGWDPVVEEVRKDRLWIAMEFCGGGSLQDIYHAQGGGLNELQIAFVCKETLSGLDYLHERNKMHRDIKGANILLTDDGDVKLADFGIAAQLTQTLVKRKSFIGTPYWMAPEVAAVERKGGYDSKCDIWAVGITAVELAETQPPMFDLHPMRALYLMTKRNFRSPTLQHKNKWSNNFHEFLLQALQKEPRKRPTANELLKNDFVNRPLSGLLMVPLIRVLEAPPSKPRVSVNDDTELDEDSTDRKPQRIPSVRSHNRVDRQKSEVASENEKLQGVDFSVSSSTKEPSQAPIPAWPETVPEPFLHKPRIQRISKMVPDNNQDESVYQSVDEQIYQSPESSGHSYGAPSGQPQQQPPRGRNNPPTPSGPPVLPRGNAPPIPSRVPPRQSSFGDVEDNHTYSNVGQSHINPPVPPRKDRERLSEPTHHPVPPIPPRARHTDNKSHYPQQSVKKQERKAYFSKIFNGCPLKLNCAASWTHPVTDVHYVMIGAEEGLFSLLITPSQDPVMEQVSPRACHWLRVVENVLVWLSSQTHIISMTNLILLFQETPKTPGQSRTRQHSSKFPDSKGCYRCCTARNPFSDQRYLLAAVPRGVLLMQWYQPRHAFMHVKLFECSLPPQLPIFDAFVSEGEDYPSLCVGIRENREHGGVDFNTINLNSSACWFDECPSVEVVNIHQLEKNTIFVATEFGARFVDQTGQLKPNSVQASRLEFDNKAESMVFLQNTILSFHRHGMQGKSLATQQITAEVKDNSKMFKLLGSHGTIIIETRQAEDLSGPSNIYILISEEQQHEM